MNERWNEQAACIKKWFMHLDRQVGAGERDGETETCIPASRGEATFTYHGDTTTNQIQIHHVFL